MIKIPGPIPVFISPLFWLMAVAIGWLSTMAPFETAVWVGIIFLSVLIHEFGHALTAKAFGQRVSIELTVYGGLTIRKNQRPLRHWKEFLIGLNGPLAGLLLAGVAYMAGKTTLAQQNPLFAYVCTVGFFLNVYWTVLNLLPIQPLDGGKLVRVTLEGFFGIVGTRIACIISILMAAAGGIFFFISHSFLIGSIFFIFAYEGYRDLTFAWKMTDNDNDSEVQEEFRQAQQEMDSGAYALALQKFINLRRKVKKGVIFNIATEGAAVVLANQGNVQEAYDLFQTIKGQVSPQGLKVLQKLAYDLGKNDEAVDAGTKAFQIQPEYPVALLNAFAQARLGNAKAAIGWIQCAIREGAPNPSVLLTNQEFRNIALDPQFQELKEKYARNGS